MERKVEKIINKLIKEGDQNLITFKEKLKEDFDAPLLVQAIILMHFKLVDVDYQRSKNEDTGILFLDPAKVFYSLDLIVANIRDKMAFVEWYLDKFISFYTTNSLEVYVNVGTKLRNKVNTYLGVSIFNSQKKQLEELKNDKKIQSTYNSYLNSAKKMEKMHSNGILYTQQYFCLSLLGMNATLIEQFKNMHRILLLNSYEDSKEKKPDSSVILKDKNIGAEVSIPSVSHRSIKEQLSQYFDFDTLKNKVLIENDIFVMVDEKLRSIYPISKVLHLEKIMLSNNKEMHQEYYCSAKNELLTEEELVKFSSIEAFLNSSHTKDPFFAAYFILCEKVVKEVNGYIYSYMALSLEKKIALKKEYIDLIQLSLENINLHMEYLPYEIVGPVL